jgi:hypothetical protein
LANPLEHIEALYLGQLQVQQHEVGKGKLRPVRKFVATLDIVDGLLSIAGHVKRVFYL